MHQIIKRWYDEAQFTTGGVRSAKGASHFDRLSRMGIWELCEQYFSGETLNASRKRQRQGRYEEDLQAARASAELGRSTVGHRGSATHAGEPKVTAEAERGTAPDDATQPPMPHTTQPKSIAQTISMALPGILEFSSKMDSHLQKLEAEQEWMRGSMASLIGALGVPVQPFIPPSPAAQSDSVQPVEAGTSYLSSQSQSQSQSYE